MRLLYTTRSPYARKTWVMALEKKIHLDMISVDLVDKPDQLTEANPLGRIPTLILDDGTALCDSTVICEYLESFVKSPVMIPHAEKQRINVLNLSRIADGLMDITVGVYMEGVTHKDAPNAKFIASREAGIKRCLQYFQERLNDLKDFDLASVSVACAIGYMYFRLEHLGPKNGFQKLDAWYQEISKRLSMAQTMPRV